MTSRSVASVLSLSFVVGWLAGAGCTGDTASTLYQSTAAQGSAAYYFPTTVGSISTFVITGYGTGSSVLTVRMGPKIGFQGDLANLWFGLRSGQSVDTNYVAVSGSGVVLFASPQSPAETILLSPFRLGQSWSRFAQTTNLTPSADTTTLATDFSGGGIVVKGNNGGGGGAGKIVPTSGSDLASIDAIEEVALSNGDHYCGALKVKMLSAQGTVNYYWFAPGAGLVKYVLEASANHADGSELGELVSLTK